MRQKTRKRAWIRTSDGYVHAEFGAIIRIAKDAWRPISPHWEGAPLRVAKTLEGAKKTIYSAERFFRKVRDRGMTRTGWGSEYRMVFGSAAPVLFDPFFGYYIPMRAQRFFIAVARGGFATSFVNRARHIRAVATAEELDALDAAVLMDDPETMNALVAELAERPWLAASTSQFVGITLHWTSSTSSNVRVSAT